MRMRHNSRAIQAGNVTHGETPILNAIVNVVANDDNDDYGAENNFSNRIVYERRDCGKDPKGL